MSDILDINLVIYLYDDIDPEIVAVLTWREVIKNAKSRTWIDDYINKIAVGEEYIRQSDREDIIKLAEAIGIRAYDRILHTESERRGNIAGVGEVKKFSNKVNDPDIFGQNKRLESENAKLKEDVARLAKRLKLEKVYTGGKMLDDHKIDVAARVLLKEARSNYDLKKFTEEIKRKYYAFRLDII